MDRTVPMHEYMRNMNLRTWILTHLKNRSITGLKYVQLEGVSGICFEFPWKRIGDQNWKHDWDILFKYAEHRGFSLPANLDEEKPKLTDIKNKFRNAIDKSQEFEKLECRSGYRMYRLKSDAQPPAKRKRKFDDCSTASSTAVSYTNMLPKHEPASPANNMYQQQQQQHDWNYTGNSGILETAAAPIMQPGLEYGELATIELEDILSELDQDPAFNDRSWQQPLPEQYQQENSRDSNASVFYEQPQQQMAPQQHVAPQQQMTPQHHVDPLQYMVQSQPPPSPQVTGPWRKIDEIVQTAHISDDEMAVFSISVTQGNEHTTDLINLKDGLQIIFTRDVNNIIREHDSMVGQLLDDVVGDNIKKYSYSGTDDNVKKILKCSYGGIILKYERKALYIWRLCQARVFVESQFHQPKRKVERCCTNSGIQRLNTFSYQKFVDDVQKNPTVDVKDSTRITIGSREVYLDVYPACTRRLKAALKPNDEAPPESINSLNQSIDDVTKQFGSTSLEPR